MLNGEDEDFGTSADDDADPSDVVLEAAGVRTIGSAVATETRLDVAVGAGGNDSASAVAVAMAW